MPVDILKELESLKLKHSQWCRDVDCLTCSHNARVDELIRKCRSCSTFDCKDKYILSCQEDPNNREN